MQKPQSGENGHVADRGDQPAGDQRGNNAADAARDATQGYEARHLAPRHNLGRQREFVDAPTGIRRHQQRDGRHRHPGVGRMHCHERERHEAGGANHQAESGHPRIDPAAHHPVRQKPAERPPKQRRGERRNPGEQRDGLQGKPAHGLKILHEPERNKIGEGIRNQPGQAEAEAEGIAQDFPIRGGSFRRVPHRRGAGLKDQTALRRGESALGLRWIVNPPPDRQQDKARRTDNHERPAPPQPERQAAHNRRRQHVAEAVGVGENRRAQPALARRNPLRQRLHAAGRIKALAQPEEKAQGGERKPADDRGMRHSNQRPKQQRRRQAQFDAKTIQGLARNGIADGVRRQEGADDIRVLLDGDAEFLAQRRREHRQRLAIEVIDDGERREQHHDAPALVLPEELPGSYHSPLRLNFFFAAAEKS